MQYIGETFHETDQNYVFIFGLILRCKTSYWWDLTSVMSQYPQGHFSHPTSKYIGSLVDLKIQ